MQRLEALIAPIPSTPDTTKAVPVVDFAPILGELALGGQPQELVQEVPQRETTPFYVSLATTAVTTR